MAMDPARRRALYVAVQTVLAGETVENCAGALCDSLGAVIGFASDTPEEADQLARGLAEDIIKNMADNWDYTRELRGAARIVGRNV
jgi:hypothetical protein